LVPNTVRKGKSMGIKRVQAWPETGS